MTIKIDGIEDVQNIMSRILPKHARNLTVTTVRAVASEVRDEVRKNTPRDTGNLRKSIKVRKRSRRQQADKNSPIFEVYAQTGKGKKYDGYYWRFIEHGTVKKEARPFVAPAVKVVSAKLDQIILDKFAQKLKAKIDREQKKIAKR